MSRRPVRRSNGGMSLFPFLAVLICTMGALVGLLMMMIARGHVVAATARETFERELVEAAEAPPPVVFPVETKGPSEATIALEDAQWRRDILLQQRKELVERLADRRAEVGFLEQSLRDFRLKADTLAAQARSLRGDDDPETLRRELADLEVRIVEETAKLEAAKERKSAEPSSYAILPYDGPNGTKRRPLFIECTAQSVMLQPEGIVLTSRDFDGPLFPGNPLDAALRAAQDYVDSHGGVGAHGSPYPLFLVREGGAVTYGAARSAMKSWENEFGYELVPDGMKLAYPPVDESLRHVMQQAIEDARLRQIALIAAQPARFAGASGGRGGGTLRALPRGGFAPVGSGGRGAPSDAVGNSFGGADAEHANLDSTGTGQGQPTKAPDVADGDSKPAGGNPLATNGAASVGNSGGASGPSSEAPDDQQSIAEQRGQGWALPERQSTTTPLDRPIRVAIEESRIVIVPEARSDRAPMQIAFAAHTRDAVAPLVAGVQERIKSWGFAGRGFYWSPRMTIEVRPGGERRFAELSRLLQNSGIVVEAAR